MAILDRISNLFFEDVDSPTKGSTRGLIDNPKVTIGRWVNSMFGFSTEATIDQREALALTAVWRAIRILSESIASLDLGVYRTLENGDEESVPDHPVHKLINSNPSMFQTSFTWRETGMLHLCLGGNHYAIIEKNGAGQVSALKVIDPNYIDDIFIDDARNQMMYSIRGLDRKVPYYNMLHVAGLSYNGFVGKDPIETHRTTLLTDKYSQEYAKKFYENGAHLSGILTHPGNLSPEAYKRIKNSFDSAYGGSNNTGRTAILEEGIEYKPLTLSPVDVAWIATRNNVVEEVSRIFGVPMHMLQSLEKATFNNIEHLSIEFIKHTLTPWVRRWEAELNRKLFTKRDRKTHFVRFDMSGLLRGDLETMGEYYTKLFNIGVLNRNEIRRYLNLNSVEDGDRYMVQGNNMVPTDKIDDLLDNRGKKGADGPDMPSITEKDGE